MGPTIWQAEQVIYGKVPGGFSFALNQTQHSDVDACLINLQQGSFHYKDPLPKQVSVLNNWEGDRSGCLPLQEHNVQRPRLALDLHNAFAKLVDGDPPVPVVQDVKQGLAVLTKGPQRLHARGLRKGTRSCFCF